MFDTPEAKFALRAVGEAARLVRQVQREMLSAAITKSDQSPVTVGDFAAQAAVARLLAETFPGTTLVGEESAAVLREPEARATLELVVGFVRRLFPNATEQQVLDWIDQGQGEATGRFWTLDPIDGTKGFLRGDQYVVALALIDHGQVQLGALGCPNLNTHGQPDLGGPGAIYLAEAGQGAWATSLESPGEFNRLHVSQNEAPTQARILGSVEAAHTNSEQMDQVLRLLGAQQSLLRMDSQAKYAALAAGKADLLLRLLSSDRPNYREKIWDHAAGAILVTEAGGRAGDLAGQDFDFGHGRSLTQNRGILVSNGKIHPAVLDALKRAGA